MKYAQIVLFDVSIFPGEKNLSEPHPPWGKVFLSLQPPIAFLSNPRVKQNEKANTFEGPGPETQSTKRRGFSHKIMEHFLSP